MKEKVKVKQQAHNVLVRSTTEVEKEGNKVRYKMEKRKVKKAVSPVKNNGCKKLYQRPDSKKGEKEIIKLARDRERRTSGLGNALKMRMVRS